MGIVDIIREDPEFQKEIEIKKQMLQRRNLYEASLKKLTEIPVILLKIFFTFFLIYLSYILIASTTYTGVFPFDYANVIIHELGHAIYRIVFSPFSFINSQFADFMHTLGGSLNQLLIPVFAGILFYLSKSWYSLFFSIFWFGDNLSILSLYIGDASCRCLGSYIGENFVSQETINPMQHDWYVILTKFGLLQSDKAIAIFVHILGDIIIATAIMLMLLNIIISIAKILNKNPLSRTPSSSAQL